MKKGVLIRLAIYAALVSIIILSIWVFKTSPWEREVSVTTSHETFTGPGPGIKILQIRDMRFVLLLGITPAPWPAEAHDIWQAARRGKVVHVAVPENGAVLRFDISGVTETGEMMIVCPSEVKAMHILQVLKIQAW
ncbi:hypothetical protein IV454_30750 [Massilia antarctica]|uniref:Uncharacterized protein n=1 Tax=Massilia antarctica TaxID=2765360 RepID=A0AA48WDY6_9BURK|nr:hypothetical protein [Massilia antarctica]QPI49747.1 hypothetical protein IV454_30750 [Massilia antarctica]